MSFETVDAPREYYCHNCHRKHVADLWIGFENNVFFCFELHEMAYVMALAEDAMNEGCPA